MSEWNNENNENKDEQQVGNTPEQTPEGSSEPAREPAPEQPPKPHYEERSTFGASPVYSWDGRKPVHPKKRGKAGVFLAVAVVCLLLTAAICLPTILYAATGDYGAQKNPGTDSTPSLPAGESFDGSFDVSQTVGITDNPYEEHSDLTVLYETCSASCASIYVTLDGGYSLGSGFVLTAEGYIATNYHVVEDGKAYKVMFYDGKEYDAELVGGDKTRDLAVLKINAKDLKPLPIGDSDALKVGQTTIAIGTPYDLTLAGTMTMGIVSGLNRKIEITNDYGTVIKTMRLIQTDTAINPGNSGGPLLNMAGQVVGINSLKLVGDYEGMGFAIPMNYAVGIFNQLIQYGKVVEDNSDHVTASPRLGVQVYNVEDGIAALGLRPRCEYPQKGALVASVEPTTAIYEAGLQLYDIIIEFEGNKIETKDDLVDILAQYKAGDTVSIKVFSFSRNFSKGEERTLTFVLDSAA